MLFSDANHIETVVIFERNGVQQQQKEEEKEEELEAQPAVCVDSPSPCDSSATEERSAEDEPVVNVQSRSKAPRQTRDQLSPRFRRLAKKRRRGLA